MSNSTFPFFLSFIRKTGSLLVIIVFASFACTKSNETPPLFQKIEASTSGIDFSNQVIESDDVNYFSANYIYIGGGIASADFNKDGLVDVYFVSVKGENKMYLNKGDFTFEDVTSKAGVGLNSGVKTGVSIIDINQDGWPDIYQCRTGVDPSTMSNILFVNQKDGTFKEEAAKYGISTNRPSTQGTWFDMDNDGDLDLYVINRPQDFATNSKVSVKETPTGVTRNNVPITGEESDQLFKNNGNGSFTDVSTEAGIINRAFSLSLIPHDFNEDGYMDIFVGNDYIEPDHVYINQKNGTFKDESASYFRHMAHFTMGSDIADFNNDTFADLVTLDMYPEDNYRQKQNATVMVLERYQSLVNYGYQDQIMRNMLQLNNGNGTFSEIACLSKVAATDWSWSALFSDLDHDGWKDLHITNGIKRDVGDLDFSNYTLDSLAKAGVSLDKFSSLLPFLPSKKIPNYCYKNLGTLGFEDVSAAWGLNEASWSNGSVHVDLDNDGDLDIIVHNTDAPASIYKNTTMEKGGSSFLKVAMQGPAENLYGYLAKATVYFQDGSSQMAEVKPTRGFLSAAIQPLHFGFPASAKVDKIQVQWPNGATQTFSNPKTNSTIIADFKQATETATPMLNKAMFTAYKALDFTHVENLYSDLANEKLIPKSYSTLGPSMAVGDLNGDKLEDIVIGGSWQQKGSIHFQQPDGTFKASTSIDKMLGYGEFTSTTLVDIDKDGDLDIYWMSGGNETFRTLVNYEDILFINDGKGNFSNVSNVIPKLLFPGGAVAILDLDNDGDMDIMRSAGIQPGAYGKWGKGYIFMNKVDGYVDQTSIWFPEFADMHFIKSIATGDLNGDGVDEIVLAGEWMDIIVMESNQGKWSDASAKYGTKGKSGLWNTVYLADVNGDGKQDILAGNIGQNSIYQPSINEPIELFLEDVDGNGTIDPLVTVIQNGKRVPTAQRGLLLSQIPGLKKKFPKFEPYANATIEDILPNWKTAKKASLNHTESGLFISGKTGHTWVSFELPAQTAPMQGITCADVNGDGHQDIIAVGNDYGFDMACAKMDASNGWVLLGDGKGSFRFWNNRAHGIWNPYEGRAVAAIQNKNQPPIIVMANNNQPILTFRNQGSAKQ